MVNYKKSKENRQKIQQLLIKWQEGEE